MFVRTGADEPATYAGCTTLRGDLGSIMDLVKKEAEEMAGEVHGMNVNPEVSSTRIYKVRFPNNFLRCLSLTTTAESAFHGGAPAGF